MYAECIDDIFKQGALFNLIAFDEGERNTSPAEKNLDLTVKKEINKWS